MKEFLYSSCVPGVWVIAVLEIVLAVLMFINFRRTRSECMLLSALLTAGLFIDAFLIGMGAFVEASALGGLSRIRFIAHGLLVPLLFAICAYALELKKPWKQIVLAITAILMVLGLAEACATVLAPVEIAGISRMASVKGQTPAWAEGISMLLSFGTVIPLMIAGIICWVRQKTPYLFLSGFFMFLFSALGPATGNTALIFYISMYGEILMVLFLFLYSRKRSEEKQ